MSQAWGWGRGQGLATGDDLWLADSDSFGAAFTSHHWVRYGNDRGFVAKPKGPVMMPSALR